MQHDAHAFWLREPGSGEIRAVTLPDPAPGDVLVTPVTGAYGHAMASLYNLREPAAEIMLPT